MPQFPDALAAEHLFDIHVDLEPAQRVGQTPGGARNIVLVKGGAVAGPKVNGSVLPGGGDWVVTRGDGVGELDVRLTMETVDGALVYMRYGGILDAKPEVFRRVYGGEDVAPSEYYFRTTPRFETSTEAYAWLNSIICVGVGALGPNVVDYRIFAIQ